MNRRTEIKVAAVYGLVEALSLDDLAVGLALGAVRVPIVVAVIAFGVTSAVMAIIGPELGAKLAVVC